MTKPACTQINPEKLILSKWTSVNPHHKEKHFIVTEVIRDEQEQIISCLLEAVINHNLYELDWRELKDLSCWLPGWR